MPTVYTPPPRLKVLPPLQWSQADLNQPVWTARSPHIEARITFAEDAPPNLRYQTHYRLGDSPNWRPTQSWPTWRDAAYWLQTAAAKFAQAQPREG